MSKVEQGETQIKSAFEANCLIRKMLRTSSQGTTGKIVVRPCNDCQHANPDSGCDYRENTPFGSPFYNPDTRTFDCGAQKGPLRRVNTNEVS